MPPRTKVYVALTLLAATGAALWSLGVPNQSWLLFALLLFLVLISSGLKVALPRGDGGMSLNFPFIFLAILRLSPGQAILLAAISTAVQCKIKVKKIFTVVQTVFNIASTILATGAACAAFLWLSRHSVAPPISLTLASVVYFFASTLTVAMVLASSTHEKVLPLWAREFPWYLPFYLVGAGLALATGLVARRFGWETSLLLIPMAYTLFRAYNAQVARSRERAAHLAETRALHLRTIEGLSMAIEAKDQNTHDHLFRVRNYVEKVGRKLHLSDLEMEALHTASFLHDIGKLAVPEHILNKPGKLTPEEFEKMKIHPVVGADILERVRFPYPVVPIVRSHHEWWDGSGYPDGLKGDQIPIGARVLAVADCFDALISDRPYRKALPVAVALSMLKEMAGKHFDPHVVEVLTDLCFRDASTERLSVQGSFTRLNTEVDVSRGEAPAAGFEGSPSSTVALPSHVPAAERLPANLPINRDLASLNLIAAASQEAQTFFGLSQSPGVSLSLHETLSVIASRLQRLVPFDTCAVFLRTGEKLNLRYVHGEDAKFFRKTPLDIGEGITGWVAQSGKPILNGNVDLETCYEARPGNVNPLRSALSIPLLDLEEENFGVLTLYSAAPEFFQNGHLRILLAMTSKLSLALHHAMSFRRAETDADAETDFLTGLPNARRLFLRLAAVFEECQATGTEVAVVVCDLNRFDTVNNQLGHLAGNRFLSLVAEGFRHIAGPEDTVARMGGGEFVFILHGAGRQTLPDRLLRIAETVDAASRRAALGIVISPSFGTAIYPEDAQSAEELLALADRRMYREKKGAGFLDAQPVSLPPLAAGQEPVPAAIAV